MLNDNKSQTCSKHENMLQLFQAETCDGIVCWLLQSLFGTSLAPMFAGLDYSKIW